MRHFRLFTLIFLFVLIFLGVACGGGGKGGGDKQPDSGKKDPAYSNMWDQMEWDKGTWAE